WRRGIMPPPPLRHLTGAMPTGFGTGTAEARMPASPWLASSSGRISGGALAILADIAFGLSIETELPPATPYTTAELSLSFLRPPHRRTSAPRDRGAPGASTATPVGAGTVPTPCLPTRRAAPPGSADPRRPARDGGARCSATGRGCARGRRPVIGAALLTPT